MANIRVQDGRRNTKYLKAKGVGTEGDPFVQENDGNLDNTDIWETLNCLLLETQITNLYLAEMTGFTLTKDDL